MCEVDGVIYSRSLLPLLVKLGKCLIDQGQTEDGIVTSSVQENKVKLFFLFGFTLYL